MSNCPHHDDHGRLQRRCQAQYLAEEAADRLFWRPAAGAQPAGPFPLAITLVVTDSLAHWT